MRTVPELVYAVEALVHSNSELDPSSLNEKDYANYKKIKNILKDDKNVDSRFLKVSNSLKTKLYASIFSFTLSKSKYSLLQRSIIQIFRQSAIANILQGLGHSSHAFEIQNSIFKKSKKYEFTEGILNSSRKLFNQEAKKGSLRKAKSYFDECQNSLIIIQNEIKAEWYNAELQNHFLRSKEITPIIKKLAQEYFSELRKIDPTYASRGFLRNFLTLGIIYYESIFDYYSLCGFLKSSLETFEELYSQDRFSILMHRLYYINYLLRLNEFSKALYQIEMGFDMCSPKSQQWFRLYELKMLHDLKIGKEISCISIYTQVKKERRFKSLSNDMRNRIELNWLYATMSMALKSKKSKARIMLNSIRIGRYLNSIPDFYLDKKGMNVSIIIVQMLYYIILEDLDKLDARFEAIEKYMSRYMKSDPLYRSHCFVKMLLQIPKQNFHPVAVERHASKYYKNLRTIPFLESKHPIEIEIIEYEKLWEQLLVYLRQK